MSRPTKQEWRAPQAAVATVLAEDDTLVHQEEQ